MASGVKPQPGSADSQVMLQGRTVTLRWWQLIAAYELLLVGGWVVVGFPGSRDAAFEATSVALVGLAGWFGYVGVVKHRPIYVSVAVTAVVLLVLVSVAQFHDRQLTATRLPSTVDILRAVTTKCSSDRQVRATRIVKQWAASPAATSINCVSPGPVGGYANGLISEYTRPLTPPCYLISSQRFEGGNEGRSPLDLVYCKQRVR